MVPCRTIPLEVPANAEIVIEGYVDPQEKLMEGPFGDHTGFYTLADWYPAFHVTAITHRKNPIYPTTIVGKPPMEDYFLGKATERIFLPLLRTMVPDIVDYSLPISGVFHNCAFIKIRKEYPYHARRVMHAIWGAGQMSFTKFIIVVDEHVNVHDEQDVLFHLFSQLRSGARQRDRPRAGGYSRSRQPRAWRGKQDRLRRDGEMARRGKSPGLAEGIGDGSGNERTG